MQTGKRYYSSLFAAGQKKLKKMKKVLAFFAKLLYDLIVVSDTHDRQL